MGGFAQYLAEDGGQISSLLLQIQRGLIKDFGSLEDALHRNGFMLGQGSFADVYTGREGGEWVFKVQRAVENRDNVWGWLAKVYSNKLWKTISLYPRIRMLDELPDGTNWCVMEKVEQLDMSIWREVTRQDWIGPQDFFDNYGKIVTLGSELPATMRKLIRRFTDGFDLKEADLRAFVLQALQFGKLDMSSKNMGLRSDGSLVIYDPVF